MKTPEQASHEFQQRKVPLGQAFGAPMDNTKKTPSNAKIFHHDAGLVLDGYAHALNICESNVRVGRNGHSSIGAFGLNDIRRSYVI